MNLFQLGNFKSASGKILPWKIECDAFTQADWEALALMASEVLPPFNFVEGVPRGGMPFAKALVKYATRGTGTVLIADDVCTSGGSLEWARGRTEWIYQEARIIGCVVFARGPCPDWVTPLFRMAGA